TVERAKRAGLAACSGVIVGMGETHDDLVDVAAALRELGVQSLPVNFLHPIAGTPLGGRPALGAADCLRALALFRLTNPRAEIRCARAKRTRKRRRKRTRTSTRRASSRTRKTTRTSTTTRRRRKKSRGRPSGSRDGHALDLEGRSRNRVAEDEVVAHHLDAAEHGGESARDGDLLDR